MNKPCVFLVRLGTMNGNVMCAPWRQRETEVKTKNPQKREANPKAMTTKGHHMERMVKKGERQEEASQGEEEAHAGNVEARTFKESALMGQCQREEYRR